jgi:hypothetical protein
MNIGETTQRKTDCDKKTGQSHGTGGLLVVQAAAILLGAFEVGAWGMKVLLRTLALGKVHALVRGLDRSAKYQARSCH